MPHRTKRLLLCLLLLPTLAFAHGEEILLTVAILVISPILFSLVILCIPFVPAERSRVIVVYLVAIALTFFLTSLLPYGTYNTWINWLLVLVPIAAAIAASHRLRAKRNRSE
ncbi:hypothetical protein J4D99_18505 [Siccationidurans ginsengisoli]|uniref:hypothetical protein n=1 Tax=Hymenobacter TaxID=89966 RepID=UPI001AADCB5E|nr:MULTISPECIES: hypothetical protein [unclassified Hymenobacter]MBO2033392.1 hypothetical protein [Hymenobacter sp. BT559]